MAVTADCQHLSRRNAVWAESAHLGVCAVVARPPDREAPMTDVQSEAADSNAQRAEVQPAESVQTPQLAGNPAVLGLMVFATGSLVLGISLLGNVPPAVQQTFVATILGTFAGFWLSYSAMVLGLTHNWYAIPPADIPHTLGQFLIGWDVAIFMLFLVTLLLPLVYSIILGAGTVGVALLAVAVMGTSSGTYRVGGVFVLIFAAFGFYAYLSGAVESVGGKALPLGKPVVSWFSK